ncbi:hypothetical protein [Streptomyces mirabilis]|uniref:hypothetical protein n=1 Tax=Streptomyces mirabilis TaxID=68239 RepID=UPI0036DDC1BE
MSPEPAPGRARTSPQDAPSGVEELGECLGDERSARALVEWAETMAVTVRPTPPKWAPSGKGYTGAVLAAVTITPGPGIVVVKLCPADQRAEHAAHTRARRASELRGDFARQHLTQQLYPPHPVGDGRLLTFQSPAGDDLRNVVTMAQLNDEDLRSTFRTVVTGLVADWNQGLESKDTELVSVSEFLRRELDTSVAEGGSAQAYGAGIENLRPDTAWIEIGGTVLPNPLTMTVGDAELPDPRILVVHGLAHGDLHLHNALVPLRRGTWCPDAFRLIDLSTFAEDAPLTRDVATLMLSVLAERAPTGLIDEHELALLRHVVDPRDAYVARIVPELALLVDDLHSACTDVASGGWQALWSDQLLLSVLATALRFTPCGGAGWHALAAPGADPAFLDNVTYHLAGALASTDLHHTTTDFRFLVERVWRSGPAALEAEAARYHSMFPVLRMDRFAMELGELVHGEAHLLAGHVRRLDLAVTLHSRCLAWKEVRRRLHHTREVLRGGLVATEPFPDDPDGRLWRVLTGHTGPVHALCWRADGRVLVSGSGDGTLRIRRVDDERPDAVVDVAGEGDGSVVSLSWSPDVSTLAVGTDRGEVVLVDPSEHRITRRLVLSAEDQQRVMVAFTPDSRAVTVALGNEVRLWHEPYDEAGLGPPLPGPRDTSGTAVRWHERGGLAVGLADGRVHLWERAATEAEPTAVDTGGPSVQALDWHPDGDLLAVIGHSATVTVIDRRSATVVARISGQARPGAAWFQSLCWTSSGDALLAGDNDGTVFVWKFTRQPDGPRLELEDTFSARGVQVRAIAPQPNEDRIAVGSRQPAVRLWILDRHSAPDAGLAERVNTVLWSPTGALAAGNAGGQLMVTDRDIGDLPAWSRYAVRAHDADLRAMAWEPDGGRLLSVGDDGRVLLWDAGPARGGPYPREETDLRGGGRLEP